MESRSDARELRCDQDTSNITATHGGQVFAGVHSHDATVCPIGPLRSRPAERCVSVPLATVATYIERRVLSGELARKLHAPCRGESLAHAVTVTGLGGTGKTQLALRHVEDHQEEYATVLWIDARTEDAVRSSYIRCCRALGLLGERASSGRIANEQGQLRESAALRSVQRWLSAREATQKWLVVIDNLDDLTWDVNVAIPRGKAGSVIVISRDSCASNLFNRQAETVEVDAFSAGEAASLFMTAVGIHVGRYDVARSSTRFESLVERLVYLLDLHPLAIDLAGAYMRAEADDGDIEQVIRRYLADYRRYRDQALTSQDVAQNPSYSTIWTVWEGCLTSLQRIEDGRGDVYPLQLLCFLTYLDRENIQEELFRLSSLGLSATYQGLEEKAPAWLEKLLCIGAEGRWDSFRYRSTVRYLLRYGLVRRTQGPWNGLTIHGLVQWRAMKQSGNPELVQKSCLLFITSACLQILEDVRDMRFRRHLITHLYAADDIIQSDGLFSNAATAWARIVIGRVWLQEGRWAEAERLFFASSQTLTALRGAGHPDAIASREWLALAYQNQGRLADAEALQVQNLKSRESTRGKDHPDTMRSMASLAVTYSDQGRWAEAEQLEAHLLAAYRRNLGERHPSTLVIASNLSSTYRNLGRLTEAEALLTQVLEIRNEVFGDQHPDTLVIRSKLASVFCMLGRLDEAKSLELGALEIYRQIFGDNHPEALNCMSNLSLIHCLQEEFNEAEELAIGVVEICKEVLREDHPDTLTSMANLALVYWKQGRLQLAERIELEVLQRRKRTLGVRHPATLLATENLLETYSTRDRPGIHHR